jgi:peptidoglycan/LPS O-acetylase OafA/YrhL
VLNGVALALLFLFPIPYDRTHWLYVSLLSLHWSIFFAWLVGWASLGFGGLGGLALESPLARYLGRISYGFYIFHPFVGVAIDKSWPGLTGPLGSASLGYLVKYAAAAVAASFSWHVVEAPINSLKSAFRYRLGQASVQPGACRSVIG